MSFVLKHPSSVGETLDAVGKDAAALETASTYVLYCTVFCIAVCSLSECTALHCTVLYCTVLTWIVLYWPVLCCTMLYYSALCRTVPYVWLLFTAQIITYCQSVRDSNLYVLSFNAHESSTGTSHFLSHRVSSRTSSFHSLIFLIHLLIRSLFFLTLLLFSSHPFL